MAVSRAERLPPRLNEAHCERIENGFPLCQVRTDAVCQPLTSMPSALLLVENTLWPLPMGRSYVKFALKAWVISNEARPFSKNGRALSRYGWKRAWSLF